MVLALITVCEMLLLQSAIGNPGEWDDSVLTKDEVNARRQRKFEAIFKRDENESCLSISAFP